MKLSFLVQLVFLIIFILGVYLVFTNNVNGRNKLILIVVCLVIAIYLFINLPFFKDHNDLIETHVDARTEYTIPTNTLKTSNGPFGLSMWIYIDDWSYEYGNIKNILKIKDLKIYLNTYKNDLILDVPKIEDDPSVEQEPVNIENINLQKWVCITFTMSGRTIDVYLNGKLVKSTPLNVVANLDLFDGTEDIKITEGKGFGGFISKVGYYPYFITPSKAWSIYKQGLGNSFLSGLDKYGMSVMFLENQQLKGMYEVF